MENTRSRRGKKPFQKIPFTEFSVRHHNNNNSDQREQFTTTTTRLPLANQMTWIADGPFFISSFFNFFFFFFFLFRFVFPFLSFFIFSLPFLDFSYFGFLDGKLDGINFSFFFVACK